MKNIYIVLILLTFSLRSFAQSSHRLSISYGFAANELARKNDLEGTESHFGKGAGMIGLRYIKTLKNNFAFETGLEYSRYKFSVSPVFHPNVVRTFRRENIELLSVPIYANYTFGKYFFVNGGIIADFHINKKEKKSFDGQSGLGAGLGIGAKYDFNRITISINPYFQKHAIFALDKEPHQERIIEAGIRFGVGYRF
ncbi:outer membrane beta-barrel protein [Dyadobacter sp. LHD-138]|uniref:outer membrane beta-barrel protein n=1 Tax=Dyadobacter sp. LHD-138 TaxID=3071413 RepID=UPI0027E0B151|nr:outer membrane beta-barrel protein [Dyadobacter sp. LHD-138]MDQ6480748.1 outer membrane beta-barrel protein [Dyadobacter sp. LHD-138]